VQVPWCETATRTPIQLPQRDNATPICPNWKRGKQNLGVVGGGDFEAVAQVERGRPHSDADSAQVADSRRGAVCWLSRSTQDRDPLAEHLFQFGQQLVGGGDFEFVAQVEHGFAALGNLQAQARVARAGELAQ